MSYNSGPESIDHLLILRGLCSFGVMIAHCLTMISGYIILEIIHNNPSLQGSIIDTVSSYFWPFTGANFIITFFVISGYLMGKIYWNKNYALTRDSVLTFYRNRFLRIAPLLYFNLIFIIALGGLIFVVLEYPLMVFGDFLFINNITGRFINPVTWSISFEMQDYLICPVFFFLFSKKSRNKLILCISSIALLAVYSFYAQSHPDNIFLQLAQYTWLFLGGYSINLLIRYAKEDLKISGSPALSLMGISLFIIANLNYYYINNVLNLKPLSQVQLLLFMIVSIILLELPYVKVVSKGIGNLIKTTFLSMLTWLGKISYGIFLWHFPILVAILNSGKLPIAVDFISRKLDTFIVLPPFLIANLLVIGIVITLTTTVSIITFFLVEVKFRPSLYAPKKEIIPES